MEIFNKEASQLLEIEDGYKVVGQGSGMQQRSAYGIRKVSSLLVGIELNGLLNAVYVLSLFFVRKKDQAVLVKGMYDGTNRRWVLPFIPA